MDQTPVPIIPTAELPSEINVLLNRTCLPRISVGRTAVYPIDMSQYSVLIDLEQLMFNLTISIGLINGTEHDAISINIYHAQEDGTFDFMSATRSKSLWRID